MAKYVFESRDFSLEKIQAADAGLSEESSLYISVDSHVAPHTCLASHHIPELHPAPPAPESSFPPMDLLTP